MTVFVKELQQIAQIDFTGKNFSASSTYAYDSASETYFVYNAINNNDGSTTVYKINSSTLQIVETITPQKLFDDGATLDAILPKAAPYGIGWNFFRVDIFYGIWADTDGTFWVCSVSCTAQDETPEGESPIDTPFVCMMHYEADWQIIMDETVFFADDESPYDMVAQYTSFPPTTSGGFLYCLDQINSRSYLISKPFQTIFRSDNVNVLPGEWDICSNNFESVDISEPPEFFYDISAVSPEQTRIRKIPNGGNINPGFQIGDPLFYTGICFDRESDIYFLTMQTGNSYYLVAADVYGRVLTSTFLGSFLGNYKFGQIECANNYIFVFTTNPTDEGSEFQSRCLIFQYLDVLPDYVKSGGDIDRRRKEPKMINNGKKKNVILGKTKRPNIKIYKSRKGKRK